MDILQKQQISSLSTSEVLDLFNSKFSASMTASALDSEVVGFKSIACYRTGLGISVTNTTAEIEDSLENAIQGYMRKGARKLRLEHKAFNDHFVRMALVIAGEQSKPGRCNIEMVFQCMPLV